MSDNATPQPTLDTHGAEGTLADGQLVAEDLIEEVSIDGMCGVY